VVLLQNAEWFPRSHMGSYYHSIATAGIGPFTAARLSGMFVGTLALLVALVALLRTWASLVSRLSRRSVVAALGVVLTGTAIALLVDSRGAVASGADGRPNVILVGIDSLRLEQLRRFGGTGWTPNLDDALRDADLFRDTTTPLARTFPSWMSILTGRNPGSTRANFNLVYRHSVIAAPTIAEKFSAQGYDTYYVTDEVRFANIDNSYGFDRVITPPIGAADFLVGRAADLPLSNVLANSRVGGTLLGYLHGNRAVANLYRPSTFLGRLRREFDPERPVFAAIHLTAAHWPYYHADTPQPENPRDGTDQPHPYMEALQTADQMFGEVMRMLRARGVLDNAIVVFLSDHGEALQLPGDSLVSDTLDGRVEGLQTPVRVVNWGHGQSVLGPVQFQVLMAFRGYGPAAGFVSTGREFPVPASLTDLFPTVMDLLGREVPAVDGLSHADLLRGEASGPDAASPRVRFTETDIRVSPGEGGEIDEDEVAAKAARLFAVDSKSGWLHLRDSEIPKLMMFKERAAIGPTLLLAAMPVAPDRHEYLLLDRDTGVGRVLTGRPPESDTEGSLLWDALHLEYAGHLHPPVIVRPEDQASFAARWAALSAGAAIPPQT
jgi:hypothetical protein